MEKIQFNDIYPLLTKVREVQEVGHYVGISFSNALDEINVNVQKGGFDFKSDYDIMLRFALGDSKKLYDDCMEYLDSLLQEGGEKCTPN